MVLSSACWHLCVGISSVHHILLPSFKFSFDGEVNYRDLGLQPWDQTNYLDLNLGPATKWLYVLKQVT